VRPLLRRLRRAFPGVPIRFGADAGFGWQPLFDLLEVEQIEYAIRIQRSKPLCRLAEPLVREAALASADRKKAQVRYTSFTNRAGTWKHPRRVLAQAQHNTHEQTVYFMVTNQTGEAEVVWQFYNGRGECENRIAESKNGFHADRLSCHRFLANAFRLALHSLSPHLSAPSNPFLPAPLPSSHTLMNDADLGAEFDSRGAPPRLRLNRPGHNPQRTRGVRIESLQFCQ